MKKLYFIVMLLCISCQKQDEWLSKKSNKSDIVPTTLEDFQALLNNDILFNNSYPALGLVSSDNYYITDDIFLAGRTVTERNAYLWLKELYGGETQTDWNNQYKMISIANIALDGILGIPKTETNKSEWEHIRGTALFYRGYANYLLVNLFCVPYNSDNAATEPGLIIRLSSDVNEKPGRTSLKASFEQIISDLKEAEHLLPVIPDLQIQPSVPAVQALLAKTYLVIGDYQSSSEYAVQALKTNNELIDFNSIDSNAKYTFPVFPGNKEVIFFAKSASYGIMSFSNQNAKIDSNLFRSYMLEDLRKKVFYRANQSAHYFIGPYTGSNTYFAGLSINELYLIASECFERLSDHNKSLSYLNDLLSKRWKKGTFIPHTINNTPNILKLILEERRKELPFNCNSRWEDLRRLNQDPLTQTKLNRKIDGQFYTLMPNDPRYTMPIPDLEVKYSGIIQNER